MDAVSAALFTRSQANQPFDLLRMTRPFPNSSATCAKSLPAQSKTFGKPSEKSASPHLAALFTPETRWTEAAGFPHAGT